MRGGVISRVPTIESLDEHVKRIIANSRRELISHGQYGFVYKLDYEESGFMDYEHGIPVTTFVMKLIPIDMYMAHRVDYDYARRTNDILYLTREIAYQRKVYKESLEKHGYAPCPAVIHHFVYTVGELDTLLPDQFVYMYGDDRPMLTTHDKTLRVGVIFMECMPGNSRSLYKESLKDKSIVAQKKAEATRLYCMALECGINHRDAHLKNFLINDEGRLTLIDFGVAETLTEKERTVLALIPPDESDDTELRDELSKLYKQDAWFLSNPFRIAPYPIPLPEEVAEQCKNGICLLDFDDRQSEEERAIRERLSQRLRDEHGALERKRKLDGERAIEDREVEVILAKRRLPEPKDPREATLFRAAQREKEGSERERIRIEWREQKRIQEEEARIAKQDALDRERRIAQEKKQKDAEKALSKSVWDRKKAEDLAAEEARVEALMHQYPKYEQMLRKKAFDNRAAEEEKINREALEAREKKAAERSAKQEASRRALVETRRLREEELQRERAEILKHRNVPTIPKEYLNDASLEQLKAEIIHVSGVLPDLSELRRLFSNEISFFNDEDYEKNMYVFYLTKIQTRGGTRKRRKRRTLKLRNKL
jgi:hypothetical protein